MLDLTAFQRDLLIIISGIEEPYGLGIKDEVEDYYEEEISIGRLYSNLNSLAEDGYLEKDEIDGRTKSYALTESGEQAVRALRKWKNDCLGEGNLDLQQA